MPPLHTYIWLGHNRRWANSPDPLGIGLEEELGYHTLVLTLLKASWRRTLALVQQRRSAIARVAQEMLEAPDERLSGARLVEIIETTPLDDTEVVIDNQFLPLLKEVLGQQLPEVLARSAQAVEAGEQQQQQPKEAGSTTSSSSGMGTAGFSSSRGRSGLAAFSRPAAAAPKGASTATSSSSSSSSSSDGDAPQLKLDDETLATVSRAIMGRLDVVDLVGRNTAQDLAERVVEALLDPATVDRLAAVRQFVEQPDGYFPPPPLAKDIGGPVYGLLPRGLEAWKKRRLNVITWSAMDMLYTERQIELYKQDMVDLPRYPDTTEGRAAAAAAAGSTTTGTFSPQ